MEAGAVAHRRRHRDDGILHKSANDRGERPFHACHCDDTVRAAHDRLLRKDAVDAADAHIIDTFDMRPEVLCRLCRFLCDGNICRAARADGHAADVLLLLFQLQDMRHRVIRDLRQEFLHDLILVGRGAGAEDFPFHLIEPSEDLSDEFVRFPLAVDHFCKAGTLLPIRIELGKSHFLIGSLRRILTDERLCRRERQRAGLHLGQYFLNTHICVLWLICCWFRVQGSGFRVSPRSVLPFDCV